jgi:hypothetical protein
MNASKPTNEPPVRLPDLTAHADTRRSGVVRRTVALGLAMFLCATATVAIYAWQRSQRERAAVAQAKDAALRVQAVLARASEAPAAGAASAGEPVSGGDASAASGSGSEMYGAASSGMGMPGMGMPAGGMAMGPPGMMSGSGMMPMDAGQAARQELEARVAPIIQRLREAQTDDQKAAVKRELSAVLEGYFDQDMQRRLAELAGIETRVKRLREQCDQRQQAKEEILKLQMKVLENEAAGLGFFGSSAPAQPMDQGMSTMYGGGMSAYPMPGAAMGMMPGMEGGGMGPYGGPPPIPTAFRKRTKLEFIETPLQDICAFLRDASGANVYLDQQALKEKQVDPQAPVTMDLDDVSVATALELIADSLSGGLGVVYEDGVAMITNLPPGAARPGWQSDGSPASQRTVAALEKTGDYSFESRPLVDVVDFVRDSTQLNLFLNRRSLSDAGIAPDAPVSINLKGVPHRTALKLILGSVNKALYYNLMDGVVVVSASRPAADPFGMSSEAPPSGAPASPAPNPLSAAGLSRGSSNVDVVASTAQPATSGAEEVAVMEAELAAVEAKVVLLKSQWEQGRIPVAEFQDAQAAVAIAKAKLTKARREYEAQEGLLQLDLEQAQVRLQAAEAELAEATLINQKNPGTIPGATVRKMELAVKEGAVAVERVKALLDLHRKADPPKEPPAQEPAPKESPSSR